MPPSMSMLPSPTMSRQLLSSQTRGSEGPTQFDMLAVDEQTSLRAGHADVETTGEVPSTPVAIDGSTHAAANGFFDDQPARFEDIVALVHSTTAKAINDALYRDALDRAQTARGTPEEEEVAKQEARFKFGLIVLASALPSLWA